MTYKAKREIAKIIADAAGVSEEDALSSLEIPKEGFGDVSSKIAFVLAKERKGNPAKIAADVAAHIKIKKDGSVEKVSAAGPYVNFYFSNAFYIEALDRISKEKKKFGKGKKTGKTMMVEYFHANTHKGVHIGHIRNISLGEALCRILDFAGNKVIRANYQGDIGPHVAKCIWGFQNLYDAKVPKDEKNLGVWLGKVYAEASKKVKDNEKLEGEVQDINLKIYAGDKKLTEIWKETRQWCLDDFEKFYKEFGVKFNELYFESQVEKLGKQISLELLEKGIAKRDDGAVIVDLKGDGLGVFVLLTKEGYSLYSAKDLGLAQLKFKKYDLDRSVHVVGKEQEFYFKQLFKTFEKAGMEKAARVSYHLIYELVMLPEGKMSSREGTIVLYEDLKQKLLDVVRQEVKKRHEDWDEKKTEETAKQIALAAIKFSMVRREPNRQIVFDWDKALSLEGDSGPYAQYAYVRTLGILENAHEKTAASKKYIFSHEERMLIKKLCEFPEAVEKSATHLAVNSLADYVLDVATSFSKFYTTCPVLSAETKDAKKSRLAIVKSTNIILKNALGLVGIECPERM